jgi:hypothetical protein
MLEVLNEHWEGQYGEVSILAQGNQSATRPAVEYLFGAFVGSASWKKLNPESRSWKLK